MKNKNKNSRISNASLLILNLSCLVRLIVVLIKTVQTNVNIDPNYKTYFTGENKYFRIIFVGTSDE